MDIHVRWEFTSIPQHAPLLLILGRIPPKLTSMLPTGKGLFPANYKLSIEKRFLQTKSLIARNTKATFSTKVQYYGMHALLLKGIFNHMIFFLNVLKMKFSNKHCQQYKYKIVLYSHWPFIV